MEIKVKKDIVKFEPIKVQVDFTITSYDELREFVTYFEDEGDVTQSTGYSSAVLSELMKDICESVADGL